jgi:hypothetical protein
MPHDAQCRQGVAALRDWPQYQLNDCDIYFLF